MTLEEINNGYFEFQRLRREYEEKKDFKLCFKCQRVLPLADFEPNDRKFQKPSQKKRGFNCKECINGKKSKRVIWRSEMMRSVNLSSKEKVILLLIDIKRKNYVNDLNNINTLEMLISKKIINSNHEIDYNAII